MNIESNLATHPNEEGTEALPEPKPSESLLIVAPKGQVPVQLEHWLRKRQMAVTVSEGSRLDSAEVRQSGARFVLIDLDGPGASDISGIRELRAEAPGVRIVAMTASSDQTFIDALTEAGVSGVI